MSVRVVPQWYVFAAEKIRDASYERDAVLVISNYDVRRVLGNGLHVRKQDQARIIRELEEYGLLLQVDQRTYRVVLTADLEW